MECKDQEGLPPREYEFKYVFPDVYIETVLRWVRQTCRQDPEFPHNIVNSIYYDGRDWRFLGEKVNSDYLKTKVRVRWYEDPENPQRPGSAYVEVKSKLGSSRTKYRVYAPFQSSWLAGANLAHPQLLQVPSMLTAHGFFFKTPIFPAFAIRYERHRFIEPISRTRICIDHHIAVPKVNPSIMPHFDPYPLASAVLEVKGDHVGLPGILARLAHIGCRKSAFSKYLACCQHLCHLQRQN